MKKLMFVLAAASIGSAAPAQQSRQPGSIVAGESVDIMEVPVDRYRVLTNRFFDNWFLTVGGGAQVLFGDQSSLGSFKKRIAPALQVSVGKWFTPGLALRLQYAGLQAKSFSSPATAYSKPHPTSDGYYEDKFNYMNLHGDIMLNLCNMLGGYDQRRVYSAIPFVGFGWAHSYDAPRRNSLTFNFGLINTFRLADAWDMSLELYAMGTENKFDGKTKDRGPDVMTGVAVSVTYKFPRRGFSPAPDVDAMMALSASQMDAINAALADQMAQNRQLQAELDARPQQTVMERVTLDREVPVQQSVFFRIGSSELPVGAAVNLQQIADWMKANPETKLNVTGYADSDTGSPAWNKQLSENRANRVADELAALGANRSNLTVSGMGGVDTLTPPACNRRVILEVQ